ncbi:glucosidase II beta subunit-like protein-domain-containing protein [Coniochaeta sp. 2T2.1]|nr:glucosidase II beta subunit-like protein-domain-containing protein [Coniochaeta sp. 2T2.1]
MRRLHIALLASSLQLCRARQPSFSIHDDVLAYPQFEIVFSDIPIPESEALSLLDSAGASATYDAGFAPSQTDLSSNIHSSSTANAPISDSNASLDPDAGGEDIILSHTHHLLTLPPNNRYLCSIPHLAPPPAPNQTATALLKQEEARELARASASGWEIMASGLEGQCLYFMSGWWSYSFCYGKEIVQFHALPNGVGKNGGLPQRDPGSAEYVLGRVHYDQGGEGTSRVAAPPNSELAVKDNQRYLLQRLDGGTLCDLTGRERTIEVQYHCHPGIPGDRIGWIKEVTTCTYLMVVQTPRLCADVAFLPPKEGRAHPVECRPVGDGQSKSWLDGVGETVDGVAEVVLSAAGVGKDKSSNKAEKPPPVTIGGVVVGGRKMLGTGADGAPAARLPSPRHLGGGGGAKTGGAAGTVVEILAKGYSKADGGRVEVLTREQLEQLDLDGEAVEALRKELQKLAGENGWKLEVVEVPGEVAEIRGIIDTPEDEVEDDDSPAKLERERAVKERAARLSKASEETRKARERERERKGGKARKDGDGEEEDGEGSEERFYRDEL